MKKELDQSQLPVTISSGSNGSNVITVTAYNSSAVLYVKEGRENYIPMHLLNDYYLVDNEKVRLFQYYVQDKNDTVSYSQWTTSSFDEYFSLYSGFILLDTQEKTVVI